MVSLFAYKKKSVIYYWVNMVGQHLSGFYYAFFLIADILFPNYWYNFYVTGSLKHFAIVAFWLYRFLRHPVYLDKHWWDLFLNCNVLCSCCVSFALFSYILFLMAANYHVLIISNYFFLNNSILLSSIRFVQFFIII